MNEREQHGCAPAVVAIVVIVLLGFMSTIAVTALVALPFMWAWSLFATPVLGLPLLSFSESFGAVLILGIISILFRTTVTRVNSK